MRVLFAILAVLAATVAAQPADTIIQYDPRLAAVLEPEPPIKTLATGFVWSEGPAWDHKRARLYFSDVPENKAYVWSADDGARVFLAPSGLQSSQPGFRETGSNGLFVASGDRLLIANHGARSVEAFDLASGIRTTLASRFQNKRFNSPNDTVEASDGTIYFTDPPYGLTGLNKSPIKELAHNGVYRLSVSGDVTLVDGSLTFPNGVALSPDEAFLYVAVSDPDAAVIYRYARQADGSFGARQVWFDATSYVRDGKPGLPDGLAIASSGHVFATGPGGVFILSPSGEVLGQIRLPKATANVTFGGEGSTLFITSSDRLLAIDTLVVGAAWRD